MNKKTIWQHVGELSERKRIINYMLAHEPIELDDSHGMLVKEIYEIDGNRYAWTYFESEDAFYPDDNCQNIFIEVIEVDKPEIYPEY